VVPLYPQKLALTSPTCDGRSVGIVRSRTQATEFFILFLCPTSAASRSRSRAVMCTRKPEVLCYVRGSIRPCTCVPLQQQHPNQRVTLFVRPCEHDRRYSMSVLFHSVRHSAATRRSGTSADHRRWGGFANYSYAMVSALYPEEFLLRTKDLLIDSDADSNQIKNEW
jgi:hypothetical protein